MSLFKFTILLFLVFILAKLLLITFSWSFFVFPAFTVSYILVVKDTWNGLWRLSLAGLFWATFSGLNTFYSLLTLEIVLISILFVKKYINLSDRSYLANFIIIALAMFEFSLLSSLQISTSFILEVNNLLSILIQSSILSAVFLYVIKKFRNNYNDPGQI